MEIVVKVRRCSGPEDKEIRFDTFKVPQQENMNVLDVVNYIQNNLDPSLAFRYSCRAGMCGTCSMRINGKNRWTCPCRDAHASYRVGCAFYRSRNPDGFGRVPALEMET